MWSLNTGLIDMKCTMKGKKVRSHNTMYMLLLNRGGHLSRFDCISRICVLME